MIGVRKLSRLCSQVLPPRSVLPLPNDPTDLRTMLPTRCWNASSALGSMVANAKAEPSLP